MLLCGCSPDSTTPPPAASDDWTTAAGEVYSQLKRSYSRVVSTSPDGRWYLLRAMDSLTFGLAVARRDATRPNRTWTFMDRPLGMQWAPDGNSVACFIDSLGNQRFHLTILNVRTGMARRVRGVETAVPLARWSHDGRRIAVVSHTDGSRRALQVIDLTLNDTADLVTPRLARYSGVTWHPRANMIAFVDARAPGAIRIYDLATGATRTHDVVPGGRLGDIAWSHDGTTLFVAARAQREEFHALVRISLATASPAKLFSTEGDVGSVRFVDKSHLVFDVTGRGQRSAFVASYDSSGTNISIRSLGAGSSVIGHTPRRDSVVVVRSTLSVAAQLDVVSLADLGAHEVRDSLISSGGPSETLSPSRPIRIRAKDGTYSHAFLWPSARGPARGALIFVHGGPAQQIMQDWDGGIAFVASRGIAVLGLNYRGSTGYGASYEASARGIDDQVEDVLAACQFAAEQLGIPWSRILVWGHSHGAQVALRAALRQPDAAGTYYLLSLPRSGPLMPLSRKRSATGPQVVLFHGAQDATNSAEDATEFVREAIARASMPARLRTIVFPDEGHTFRRLWHWSEVYARVVRSVGS
jgi:dipeptidyl aminopeptidase/acylaminoacyl peptidase